MRKRISICLIAMFCIIVLSGGFIFFTKKDTPMEGNNMNQSNHNSSQNQDISAVTPEYEPRIFDNVEGMLEWIQTENVSDFEDGRFEKGIHALREQGKLLVPSYSDSKMTLRFIEVLPDSYSEDGNTTLAFYYYTDTERIVVFTKPINTSYKKQAGRGLTNYLAVQYDEYNEKSDVQSDIQMDGNEQVPYVMLNDEENIQESDVRQAVFLNDDFEVKVTQGAEDWSNEYLSELQFDTVEIKN